MMLDPGPRSPCTPPSHPGILHRRTHAAGMSVSLGVYITMDCGQRSKPPPSDRAPPSTIDPVANPGEPETSSQRVLASYADLPNPLVRTPHLRQRDRGRFTLISIKLIRMVLTTRH
ncbi:hypothetical protein FRC12_022566 [Ceratobasidium sp. 428]|nr:hypothetical protein FRC12_022566 [Ceratobasidium sp. 428]